MIPLSSKFIDLVTTNLNTAEWPLPQADNHAIPKFNYEVIKVSKRVSQILVNQLKPPSADVCLHPKFASVIIAEKYCVGVHKFESDETIDNPWDSYLAQVESSQVCQSIAVPFSLNLQNSMIHRETFGFLEQLISEYSVDLEGDKVESVGKLRPIMNNIFVVEPIILQPQAAVKKPSLPVWQANEKVSFFDIIEQELESKLPQSQPEAISLLPVQHNLVKKYCIGLDIPTIVEPKRNNDSCGFDFPNWTGPQLTNRYDNHDLNLYLFENEPTRSRKYLVHPIAKCNKVEDKPPEYFIQQYINKYFNTKSWHLNKYQLIVEMEWKPIIANIKTLQNHFLVETIDSVISPRFQLSVTTAVGEDIELGPFDSDETLALDYPQLQEYTTETATTSSSTIQIEPDNGATNLATYHDDTEALVKLVSTKKRKLNTKMVDIPHELALLSFLHPKKETETKEEELKEKTSTESILPQYSIFFDSSFSEPAKEYQFPSNQYIALSQSFWNKDYLLAKGLSDKRIGIVEAKFNHAVDIVINTTSAIYTTPAELLVQGDGKTTDFLILEELLTMKQHFHRLYVIAIVNTPSFVEFAGPKLQTMQLICLAIDIKLLFVSRDDALLWCLEIIDSEPPQIINNEPIDLDNQHFGLLCECGLTYFQAHALLQKTSLTAFISCTVDEKLKNFKELVTPELLVCFLIPTCL
ncbi:hypothetical protein CANMA_003214 [Candida margitis]|uniref:uncharacterized protein n=1 Tax=Candida margitis TaxID=1775924 RepID=UPI0022270571|nr:uncharacterized protein CANMA_003214 [Candida margitis]KAI5967157.1 hypothetical protein CANMA_003214 [Candida margitis]